MLDAVDLPERFKAAQPLLLRQIAVRGGMKEGEGSEGGGREIECRSKGGREVRGRVSGGGVRERTYFDYNELW